MPTRRTSSSATSGSHTFQTSSLPLEIPEADSQEVQTGLLDDDDDEKSFSSVESPHSQINAAHSEHIPDAFNARASRNPYVLGDKIFDGTQSDMLESGGRRVFLSGDTAGNATTTNPETTETSTSTAIPAPVRASKRDNKGIIDKFDPQDYKGSGFDSQSSAFIVPASGNDTADSDGEESASDEVFVAFTNMASELAPTTTAATTSRSQQRHDKKKIAKMWTKAPKSRAFWDDEERVARCVIALDKLVHAWSSDDALRSRGLAWERLVDKSQDSHWQYYCLVRALTNTHVAIDSFPAEVSDALFTFVDIVALNRSIDTACPIPSHLRHHEQEEGSRTAPLNNIASSELTLSALAAGR
jgi:hypothetical protein